ncbi:MAG TPA: hypothetical protein PKC95_00070 [Thauera aminoaromatica]|nr:hypothetical protein [Thauera aminoaromatica]
MSARELDDWVAFWKVEPWGAWRDNVHAGLIASVIANAHRGRGVPAFSPANFMLQERDPAVDQVKVANIVSFFRRAAKPKDKQP